MVLGLAIVALVVMWPEEALAWGPVTHLIHGSRVLESVSTLPTALQEILAAHRLAYLYGCIAPDIMHAKRYTRSVYTHCHCWEVGWQVLEAASTDRQQAFARGYLSHLAGDVLSHNHFVPVRLVTSYETVGSRHLYWEARFDAAQPGEPWQLLRAVLDHPPDDLDDLVERVVERTLFSFRTNKRIFNSVLLLQQLEQWQQLVREFNRRSRFRIETSEVAHFNDACVTSIVDLLCTERDSSCQAADPTGREALDRASRLRRKLRALRRQGDLPQTILSELNALGTVA